MFQKTFLNFIKSYFLDGVNIFFLQLHYHQQSHVSLFGLAKHVKIDNNSICFDSLSNDNLNFVRQLFDFDGSLKFGECLKDLFRLKNNMQFQ